METHHRLLTPSHSGEGFYEPKDSDRQPLIDSPDDKSPKQKKKRLKIQQATSASRSGSSVDSQPKAMTTACGGTNVRVHTGVTVVASTWLCIQSMVLWTLYDALMDYMHMRAYGTKRREEDEETSCEFGSPKFYALCAFGGVLSCGITHTAVTPLDLVKCRIQVNPEKYKGIFHGWKLTFQEEGARALVKGWAPTCIGYSMQGLGKFGFYEVFKIMYANMIGEEMAYQWRTTLYLAASASAEFFADMMLAPMEAAKVRIQTQPTAPPTLRGTGRLIWQNEGIRGFYKGLPPLWMRQIPYTMMKFACFERTVEALYKYVVPKPRSECSKPEQLLVTFIAGYIAGVFCAIVSHPPDSVVSKLNQNPGASPLGILKELGWKGAWRGLGPRIVMIGTLTALQWFIYDSVKVFFRLPRPPPPEMPESLRKKLQAAGKLA